MSKGQPAQDRLQNSEGEGRLSAIFAHAPVGLCEIAPDGRFLRVNAAVCAMLGRSEAELLAGSLVDVTDERDLAASLEHLRHTIATGAPASFVTRHRRADGAVVWAGSSLSRLDGEHGATQGVLVVTADLTAQHAAQEALRASEEFNRRVLASSADCIKVLDLDGHLEFMSEGGMCVMEVEDFSAIAGRCWPDFWLDDERPKARAAVETARRGGTGRFQGFATTMKGTPRWWDVIVTPITGASGEVERLLSISRDVTQVKRAEQQLHALNANLEQRVRERTAQRDMLATIIETTDLLVMACDLDYGVIAINQSASSEFERIYGVTLQAGDNMLAALAGRPEDQAQVRTAWSRGLAGEETCFIEAFGDPDRARPSYEIQFRSLHDADGVRIGAYQFVTDVTDRLRRERQLSDVQEALRQSQKVEALGQLTGGIAHDFNNLLTVIRSSADLLRRRDLPDERRRRYIDAIADTADRAAKLTGQLLAFARRQALRPEVFDAAARVGGIADMLHTLLGPGITLAIERNVGQCFVEADAAQFDSAVVNMAINGRDAMAGHGTLTIGARCIAAMPPVRGVRGAAGAFVAVSVSDTGCGIAPEHMDSIFEPFFTTKSVGKGTGLGLSQLFGFAKQSGGEVDVASAPGKGAVFTLYLPQAAAAPAADQSAADARGRPERGRILVIEDNAEVGEFATQLLADLGYEPTLLTNGADALALLARGSPRFDLVFSDVVMPGIGGIELGQTIRGRWPTLPVVLTSGYSHTLATDAHHGFPLVQKPYAVEELARVLREAIAG